jgi:hypothetical protein
MQAIALLQSSQAHERLIGLSNNNIIINPDNNANNASTNQSLQINQATEDKESEKEESETDNENEQGADDDESIDLDTLEDGYDWAALMVDDDSNDKKKKRYQHPNVIIIAKDHLDSTKNPNEETARRRCRFLGWTETEENINKCLHELNGHAFQIKENIKHILHMFWIDIAMKIDFKLRRKRTIGDYSELLSAIRQVSNYTEARKVVALLYLSFDYVPDFDFQIEDIIMTKLNFRYRDDNEMNIPIGERREAKSFLARMVNQILTEQRKNFNLQSKGTCGLTYTKTRHGDALENARGFRDQRKFYPWMIMGNLVSNSNNLVEFGVDLVKIMIIW